MTQRAIATQPATFNIGIKPKQPPVFNGRANEDIDMWLAKVEILFTLLKQTVVPPPNGAAQPNTLGGEER